jgi:hypothetical protein
MAAGSSWRAAFGVWLALLAASFSPGLADFLQAAGAWLAIAVLAPRVLAAALLASPVWIAKWAVRRYVRPSGCGASRS